VIERIRAPLGLPGPRGGRGEKKRERERERQTTYEMYFSGWRTHFLPHEDVVDHGAPAEHNAEADEDRRDDRRRRVELDERVQDHACGPQISAN